MQVELWPIDRPKPYPRNARKLSIHAIDKVAASIREFGWRQPIVVDANGVVICGHTRLLAARELGCPEVPVHVAENLTPAQARAYRLMDNRSHQESTWDEELLAGEMFDLKGLDIDLTLTGFESREIDRYLAGLDAFQGLKDEDAVPEEPEDAVTRPGDVWILGEHRLLCGDATSASDVSRLLNGAHPVLMTTDPPYGVEYDPEWRARAGVNNNTGKLGKVENDHRADWREAWELFSGNVMYVWHAGKYAAIVQQSIEACGFEIRSQIIWAKDRFALSRGNYHWQHEPCWYAVRNNANWNGDRSQSTLWTVKTRENDGYGHGTQKPVECLRRPMLNNSRPGQLVYDPFLGSGTSIMAAETSGRVCYGLEINRSYCDVIVKRWQDFTGKTGILEIDGGTFQQVAAARAAISPDSPVAEGERPQPV